MDNFTDNVTISRKAKLVPVGSLKVGSYFIYNDQLSTVMGADSCSSRGVSTWNLTHPGRQVFSMTDEVQEVVVKIEYEYKL